MVGGPRWWEHEQPLTLRTKTLLVIGLTLLGLLALLYLTANQILLAGFARLEGQEVRNNVQRVLDALADDLTGLNTTAADNAAWDDTYVFVADGNAAYVEENLVDQTFGNLRLNVLANVNLREALRHQAIRDPLTGLFNRRYMQETLEREISRSVRNERPVGLLFLDLDHFKRFNDTHGHDAGDALLREFGALLRAEVKLLTVKHYGQVLGAVTLSVGVAMYPEHGSTGEFVIRAADQALYRAKQAGRDRVSLPVEDPGG